MGSENLDNEKTVHKVKIKNSFYLGKYRTYAVELKNQAHQAANCLKRDFNPQSLM